MLSLNSQGQVNQSRYLNRVGFIDLVVGYDINVVGDYAYLTNNDGLMIVDISNPSNPVKAGEVSIIDGGTWASQVIDDIAYISSVTQGFIIANVSNPQNPQIIGQSTDQNGGSKVLIDGSLAYVSHELSGLSIFDISDLSNPIRLKYISDTWNTGLAIIDDILYVGNPNVGVRIYNISNPTSVTYIQTISDTRGVYDIHIANDIMFLACHQYGIKIFDISLSTSPTLIGSYDDDDPYEEEGEALGLVKKDDLLYVADNYGIEVFNAIDPTTIVEIAERSSDVIAAHDIAVDDEYIYVALGGGLLILKLSTTPEASTPDYGLIITIVIISVAIAGVVISIVVYLRFFRFRMKGASFYSTAKFGS